MVITEKNYGQKLIDEKVISNDKLHEMGYIGCFLMKIFGKWINYCWYSWSCPYWQDAVQLIICIMKWVMRKPQPWCQELMEVCPEPKKVLPDVSRVTLTALVTGSTWWKPKSKKRIMITLNNFFFVIFII